MAINAGQRITAGLLSADSDGTPITNDTLAAANVWEQWGTETVTFANPGVDVKVLANLSGYLLDASAATHVGRVRIGISLNGGSTYNTGNEPQGSVGSGAGARTPISSGHKHSGTPTGNIVVKAEFFGSTTDVQALAGFLQVDLKPVS